METFPTTMNITELQQKALDVIVPLKLYLESVAYTCSNFEIRNFSASQAIGIDFQHAPSGRIISVFISERLGVAAYIQEKLNGDQFGLTDYLKTKTNKTFLTLTDRKNDESWEHYATRCVDIILNLLKTDLERVVKGQEWISVPFDWSIAGR